MDNLKLGTWRIVYHYWEIEHHTLIEMSSIFIERDGNYFFIYDETEKIDDIIKMPSYIREDWIYYNKKPISLFLIDDGIKKLDKVQEDWARDVTYELMSIRRDFQISKVL